MKKIILLSVLAAALSAPVYASEHPAPVAAELADGTKIEISGEDVSVVSDDGTKTPAPDGTHTLKDGATVTTKDGKKVAE